MRTVYRLRAAAFTRVAWEEMEYDDVFAEDGGSGPDPWTHLGTCGAHGDDA